MSRLDTDRNRATRHRTPAMAVPNVRRRLVKPVDCRSKPRRRSSTTRRLPFEATSTAVPVLHSPFLSTPRAIGGGRWQDRDARDHSSSSSVGSGTSISGPRSYFGVLANLCIRRFSSSVIRPDIYTALMETPKSNFEYNWVNQDCSECYRAVTWFVTVRRGPDRPGADRTQSDSSVDRPGYTPATRARRIREPTTSTTESSFRGICVLPEGEGRLRYPRDTVASNTGPVEEQRGTHG